MNLGSCGACGTRNRGTIDPDYFLRDRKCWFQASGSKPVSASIKPIFLKLLFIKCEEGIERGIINGALPCPKWNVDATERNIASEKVTQVSEGHKL